jgi:hypothetical protein
LRILRTKHIAQENSNRANDGDQCRTSEYCLPL